MTAGGGGGGARAGGRYCMLHFVFIWLGKFYFCQGKVRKFCTLMSVATMLLLHYGFWQMDTKYFNSFRQYLENYYV